MASQLVWRLLHWYTWCIRLPCPSRIHSQATSMLSERHSQRVERLNHKVAEYNRKEDISSQKVEGLDRREIEELVSRPPAGEGGRCRTPNLYAFNRTSATLLGVWWMIARWFAESRLSYGYKQHMQCEVVRFSTSSCTPYSFKMHLCNAHLMQRSIVSFSLSSVRSKSAFACLWNGYFFLFL